MGALPTDYTFTGQKNDASDGLMFYGARYYDASIGRFTQPDTIVSNLYRPQDLNRYSYVQNNPLTYTDPTGHHVDEPEDNGPCDDACQKKVEQYQIAAANPPNYCANNLYSNGCYTPPATTGGSQTPYDEFCAKHRNVKACRDDTASNGNNSHWTPPPPTTTKCDSPTGCIGSNPFPPNQHDTMPGGLPNVLLTSFTISYGIFGYRGVFGLDFVNMLGTGEEWLFVTSADPQYECKGGLLCPDFLTLQTGGAAEGGMM